jgi:hypothetical protein
MAWARSDISSEDEGAVITDEQLRAMLRTYKLVRLARREFAQNKKEVRAFLSHVVEGSPGMPNRCSAARGLMAFR